MSTETGPAILDAFKAGRRRTIALIVAGIIAVGGLGAVAAVAFGHDDEPLPTNGLEEGSDFDPTPVALPNEPGEDPTPIPTISPERSTDSDTVTIGDEVEIFVPRAWRVAASDQDEVILINGKGSLIKAFAGTANTTDAVRLVQDATGRLGLPVGSKYTDPTTLEPKGTVVSAAYFDYWYKIADQQGTMKFAGRGYILTRQDKSVLILGAEHTPPKKWSQGFDAMLPVLEEAYARFAGL